MTENTDTTGARIEFRVEPAIAARVDACAHYAGQSRTGWLRLSVAHTDTTQTLMELDRLEQAGGLNPDQERVRAEALQTLADVQRALRPKPLIAMSPN